MPRSVAFFRNLNLGQGWAPTRLQLIAAFEQAGATEVLNVQGNGTVVFTHRAPRRTTDAVLVALRALTAYDDIAVVRSADWVSELARRIVTLELDLEHPSEVILFDAATPPVQPPWVGGPGGRITIVAGDHRHAVTVYRPEGRGGSNAGPLLQRLTGVKGTGRSTGTMLRLARRIES